MKQVSLFAMFVCALFGSAFAAQDGKNDFPLTVHIVQIDAAQGNVGVVGSGSTDSDGNYSSHVSGGQTYLYHVYTVHIDGDQRELTMTTPRTHYKGGRGLAVATMGWSAVATTRRNAVLHIGDYKGRWNKDGSIEIEFLDDKGTARHEPFMIQGEKLLGPAPASDKQSQK